MSETRCALVIAGGRSRRFGRTEKATVPVAGVPMIRRIVRRLAHVVSHAVINCRRSQTPTIANAIGEPPLSVTFAHDERPDRGPLAGIERAVGTADSIDADRAFVIGCDMPCLDPAVIELLFDYCGDGAGAIPCDRTGRPQPLHGVYRLAPLERAIKRCDRRGRHSVTALLDVLDVSVLAPETIQTAGRLRTCINVNTPTDLEALERLLELRSE
ncbi:molybdenum cofactor guanylyltransferase [Halocatena halophila]|uniref:molybdenum cofactor guanylyltransferase n=1 Tax=Halocatena halophila TaxID=2814576 RepID=UPI002ED09491